MLEQVTLALIIVGLTIGAVLAALWVQARRSSRLGLALIRLNEQLGFDLPAFLDQAWPLLERSSLRGIGWELDWYGVRKQGQFGQARGSLTERVVAVGDMKLALRFHRDAARGEQAYFEEALIETFMLLLRTDMLIKAAATDATLSHMARLNLFLQHDMKNIAQFIQLMGDQLSSVPVGKEHKVLEYLRVATPLIRHRADRIVRTLMVGAAPAEAPRALALRPLLVQLCQLYGLACVIDGDGEVAAAGSALETVLDNILKNYQDVGARLGLGPMELRIAIVPAGAGFDIALWAPQSGPVAAPERLFEPFWSSTPAGLGIGLYQARHLMEMQGGSLSAGTDAQGALRFHLHCPRHLGQVKAQADCGEHTDTL